MFGRRWRRRRKDKEESVDLVDVVSVPRNSVAEEESGEELDQETVTTTAEDFEDLVQAICNEKSNEKYEDWKKKLENMPVERRQKLLTTQDEDEWTPLHHAARYYRTAILESALGLDGDVFNMKTHDGLTPLLVAAKYNRKNAVLWLLQTEEAEVDTERVDENEQNALHLAAQHMECEYTIEPLVRQLEDLCCKPDEDGNTPLHTAAMLGNIQAMEYGLLSTDICEDEDIDFDEEEEESEMEEEELEEEEEEEEVVDEEEVTEEMTKNSVLKSRLCQPNARGETPLHLAVRYERTRTVCKLVRMWPQSCLIADHDGNLPLHMACKKGYLRIARVLMHSMYGSDKYERSIKRLKCKKRDDDGLSERLKSLNKHMQKRKEKERKVLLKSMNARNGKDETPLHCAAYNDRDNGELMEFVMKSCAEIVTDDEQEVKFSLEEVLASKSEEKYIPLMLSCKEGKLKVLKVLLRVESQRQALHKVRVKEDAKRNCLELAAINGHRDIAKFIIEDPHWKDSLTMLSETEHGREDTPFRTLIRHMPSIATLVLDKCSEPTFNYEFVEDIYDFEKKTDGAIVSDSSSDALGGDDSDAPEAETMPDTSCGSTRRWENRRQKWKPKIRDKENHPLAIMVRHQCKELLQHKMITVLLDYKWTRFGVWFYLFNLLLYLIFVIFLTGFALALPNPQFEECANRTTSQANVHCDSSNTLNRENFLHLAAAVASTVAVIRLILELIQFIRVYEKIDGKQRKTWVEFNWNYFGDWTNWVEVPLFLLTPIFVVVTKKCVCPERWQWQLGTVVVFLAWINLLTFLYKLPAFGLYLLMMEQIVKKFLRVMIIAFLFSIAFGFAFYMTFYEPSILASPFANPGLAITTIFAMTAGGPDYSIFRLSNDEGSGAAEDTPFPVVAYIVWVLFIVIMAILFLNFLTGLAVDDVQQIRERAEFEVLRLKVELILGIGEKFFFFRNFRLCGRIFVLPEKKESSSDKEPPKVIKLAKQLYESLIWGSVSSPASEEDTDYKLDQLRAVVDKLMERSEEQEMIIKEQQRMMVKHGELMKEILAEMRDKRNP